MTDAASPAYDPTNIFARILRGELPCEKVYEDDVALALMDIMPRADGHVLVIPKVPARGLLDMPADALSALMPSVQKVAAAVKAGMRADGLTLQQFNESAGGQVVFHLHFHILPRWNGVSLRPHSGTMERPEVLRQHADRIRAALG
jgi:histidine triad (HIT) family protein